MDLFKTRRISRILQKNVGHHLVDFDEVAEALCDVIGANVYIVNPEGKLWAAIDHEIENERMEQYLKDRQFPGEYARADGCGKDVSQYERGGSLDRLSRGNERYV